MKRQPAKKKKPIFEDDGRTVARMDFDGAPWGPASRAVATEQPAAPASPASSEPLSRQQFMLALRGALLASLLIGLVFIGVFFLFLLFAVNVWLK